MAVDKRLARGQRRLLVSFLVFPCSVFCNEIKKKARGACCVDFFYLFVVLLIKNI